MSQRSEILNVISSEAVAIIECVRESRTRTCTDELRRRCNGIPDLYETLSRLDRGEEMPL